MYFDRNSAEDIFNNNIKHIIKAEVLTEDKEKTHIFQGRLEKIFCNTFIITNNNCVEMFRYEDLRSLQVIEERTIHI